MSNVVDITAENEQPINNDNKNEDDLKQFKEDVMKELNYLDYSVSGIEVYERKCRFYFARKWFEFEIYDTEKVLKVYTMNQFQPIVSTLLVEEDQKNFSTYAADPSVSIFSPSLIVQVVFFFYEQNKICSPSFHTCLQKQITLYPGPEVIKLVEVFSYVFSCYLNGCIGGRGRFFKIGGISMDPYYAAAIKHFFY